MQFSHIYIEAEPRYWEDAIVNGKSEDDDAPTIPLRDGKLWKLSIRLADGKVENWPTSVTADVHYKVCDQGEYWLTDDDCTRIMKWRGFYVPDEFLCPYENGYGDYIIMQIGPDGIVEGWNCPDIDKDEWVNV